MCIDVFHVRYFEYTGRTYLFFIQDKCDNIRRYPCIHGPISVALQIDSLLFGELAKSLGGGLQVLGFQVCLLRAPRSVN